MVAEDYALDLIEKLKERGFKKSKLTWIKSNEELTVIFNIQKSQYSNDNWYYNLGIGINVLHEKKSVPLVHVIWYTD